MSAFAMLEIAAARLPFEPGEEPNIEHRTSNAEHQAPPTEPALVSCCATCERVRINGEYLSLDLANELGLLPGWFEFTHGICPQCEALAVAKLSPAARAIWLENRFKNGN